MTDFNMAALWMGYWTAFATGTLPSNGQAASLADFSAVGLGFHVRYYNLFEFLDNNGVPGYQANSSDSIVTKYDLSTATWKTIGLNRFNITDQTTGETVEVYSATMQTTDEVFGLRISGSGHPLAIGETLQEKLDSSSLKIDLLIQYYNYSGASSNPNTYIGMGVLFGAHAGTAGVNAQVDTATPSPNNGNPAVNFYDPSAVAQKLVYEYDSTADATFSGSITSKTNIHLDTVVDPDAVTSALLRLYLDTTWILKVGWFSFDAQHPLSIYWDPGVSATGTSDPNVVSTSTPSPSSTPSGPSSSAASLVVCVWLLLVTVVLML